MMKIYTANTSSSYQPEATKPTKPPTRPSTIKTTQKPLTTPQKDDDEDEDDDDDDENKGSGKNGGIFLCANISDQFFILQIHRLSWSLRS